jgi:hypothetical protein
MSGVELLTGRCCVMLAVDQGLSMALVCGIQDGPPLQYLMRRVAAGSDLKLLMMIHWAEAATPSLARTTSNPLKLKCGMCVDRLVCVTVCVPVFVFDIFVLEVVGLTWLTSFAVFRVCAVLSTVQCVCSQQWQLCPCINPTSFHDVMSTLWRQLTA